MPRVRLTKEFIEKLKFPERLTSDHSTFLVHDADVRQLAVRVYANGRKKFVLRYRDAYGRFRFHDLCEYSPGPDGTSLFQVRSQAQRKLGEIEGGTDPNRERKARRATVTVKELCDRYVREVSSKKRSGWQDEVRIERRIKRQLGPLLLPEVTPKHIADLHQRISDMGFKTEANRVRSLISHIWTKALEWGLIPYGVAKPTLGVVKNPEKPRTSGALRDEQVDDLVNAILAYGPAPVADRPEEGADAKIVRAVFLFLLATGLRKGEVLGARWEHVNIDRETLFLPDTKAGEPRSVPLSSEAIKVLEETRAVVMAIGGSPWVFPSVARPGQPLQSINKAWERIRAKAGLPAVRIHDLRHNIGSRLADAGASAYLIQQALGHKTLRASQIYVHPSHEPVRLLMDRVTARKKR